MERLTEKHVKKNGGYYMKCSEYCEREETMCIECERSDEIVDRLGAIEDILGDDYDLDRLAYLEGLPPEKRKVAAQQRAYREANREKVAAQKRAYREANREKYNDYMRAYMREYWKRKRGEHSERG